MLDLGSRDERILLVEDEEPIRDLVSTALRFTGFTVESAASGPEGLAMARNSAWHLLVLDVNLPGLDGFEVLHFIRKRPELSGCKVVMLTTATASADRQRGEEEGADDYMVKPFEASDLREIVQRYLS